LLDGGGWSTPRPGRFAPGNDAVPIVQEAGWTAGSVSTGAENLVPTGIRSPDLQSAASRSTERVCFTLYQSLVNMVDLRGWTTSQVLVYQIPSLSNYSSVFNKEGKDKVFVLLKHKILVTTRRK
jgi:hypothetical protein